MPEQECFRRRQAFLPVPSLRGKSGWIYQESMTKIIVNYSGCWFQRVYKEQETSNLFYAKTMIYTYTELVCKF